MLKLKNIEPAKLNRIRLSVLIFTYLFFCLADSIYYFTDIKYFADVGFIFTLMVLCLFLIALILFKRETISLTFKRVLFVLILISGLAVLIMAFTDTYLYYNLPRNLYWFLLDISHATLISVIILFYYYLYSQDRYHCTGIDYGHPDWIISEPDRFGG